MRAPRHAYAAFAILFAISCGPSKHNGDDPDGGVDGDGVPTGPHKLDTVEITPLNALIELDLNTAGQQAFTATGHYLDGTSEDFTDKAVWTSSNPNVGTLTGATLSIPGFATAQAQTTKLTATYDGYIGEAQLTVVAYRKSGAQQDFFFILPYTDPAGDQKKPLEFATAVPALDVFFLVDTTGSMGGEIGNLKNGLNNTIVPQIVAAVPDTQFGVGTYQDFPTGGYGTSGCDQPFRLMQTITSNQAAVTSGVNALLNGSGGPIGCGNDGPESLLEGVYQSATGDGLAGPAPTSVAANHTGIGGAAFRAGTMPVIVGMGDAVSHTVGEANAYNSTVAAFAHSRAQVKTALSNICARVVGVSSNISDNSLGDYTDLANYTGARVPPAAWDFGGARPGGCDAGQCCTGTGGAGRAPEADGKCPLSYLMGADGSGLSTNISLGIQMLARFATFTVESAKEGVTTDVDGNVIPNGHNTAEFIRAITPVSATVPPAPPVVDAPTFDATKFYNVTPATQVFFDVTAFNDFVMQLSGQAQFFQATIRVLAGGCTPLDERKVLILVPPAPVVIGRHVQTAAR